ncbi:DUF1641 domain-containing protein [Bacillus sp. Marseille-P3661]|uniref:DUF1641 domain-containing protein n=1 Tax=Bacillus sp. Marseille-P3661 TaxID=1936234 RepID=UPI0035B53EAA
MFNNGFQNKSSENDQVKTELFDQLSKPEVQESLTTLIENLPKIVEMTTALNKSYDLIQSLTTDRVLYEDLMGGMKEFIEPVESTVKGMAATAIEAKDRAQANDQKTIGLFGLLKMLKDPQVQKMFRFVQAYLDITSEKQAKGNAQ